MTTVYLIRHGAAEGNRFHRLQGHYDGLLTKRGYSQLPALAQRFSGVPIDAVYSSDLYRARTTAFAVALSHGLPVHEIRNFRELRFGEWEDTPLSNLTYRAPEQLNDYFFDPAHWRVPGSESFQELRERVGCAFENVIRNHPNHTVVIVSHGHAIQMLLGMVFRLDIQESYFKGVGKNTSVTRIETDGSSFNVTELYDVRHLEKLLKGQKAYRIQGQPPLNFIRAEEAGSFIIKHEDRTVGRMAVSVKEDAGWLSDVFLEPEYRGCGLGVQLIGQAVSWARGEGCTRLCAALPSGNETLLQRFQDYEFVRNGFTNDDIIMEKPLIISKEQAENIVRNLFREYGIMDGRTV